LPARSRIPAITGAPVAVLIAATSGDRPFAQHLLASDLRVPVAGALLAVPEHWPQQRINIDQCPLLEARQQTGDTEEVDQMGAQHRSQLQGVAVRALAQELPERRRRVHAGEQALHPA